MSTDDRLASYDPGVTRASIFLRLNADDTRLREMSWREFDRCYAPFIRGYAERLGFRGSDADELVQMVIAGFFAASPRFVYDRAKGRFRGYLTYATRSSAARIKAQASHQQALGEYDPAAPEDPQAVEVWDRVALARAIQEVRGQVDAKTFQAFEMYTRLKVPAEEVARQLGMSVDSVHQAKTRLSRKIRDAFDRYTQEA